MKVGVRLSRTWGQDKNRFTLTPKSALHRLVDPHKQCNDIPHNLVPLLFCNPSLSTLKLWWTCSTVLATSTRSMFPSSASACDDICLVPVSFVGRERGIWNIMVGMDADSQMRPSFVFRKTRHAIIFMSTIFGTDKTDSYTSDTPGM